MPSAILVNGKPILLNTDFRVWIKFYKELENTEEEIDISYLFANELPIIDDEIYEQLIMFMYNPSITPKQEANSSDKIMDYLLDGDYIFSALYAKYGIDITNIDMHWHKFKALVDNVVGEDTLLGIAKNARGYKKRPKNHDIEKDYENNKIAWTLPSDQKEFTDEEIDDFNDWYEKGVM